MAGWEFGSGSIWDQGPPCQSLDAAQADAVLLSQPALCSAYSAVAQQLTEDLLTKPIDEPQSPAGLPGG
jgi:hypothetical protein